MPSSDIRSLHQMHPVGGCSSGCVPGQPVHPMKPGAEQGSSWSLKRFIERAPAFTRKGLKVNSSQELIAEMPANPGNLGCASNEIDANSHLAGANLLCLTGCKAEHVPYRSGVEAIQAQVNGNVQWAFDVLHGPKLRRQHPHPHGVAGSAAADSGRPFTYGQNAYGDRHVYASRTRFMPAPLLPRFESTSWPPTRDTAGADRCRRAVARGVALSERGAR